MKGPFHLSVVNRSSADDTEVAWWVEAANFQLREHVKPMWRELAGPLSVFFYPGDAGIPDASSVIWILDDAGKPGLAGWHTRIGSQAVGAVDLSRSGSLPSEVLSHEAIEMGLNLWMDAWDFDPDRPGVELAREGVDPVQRQGYLVTVEILGRRRDVSVSNFVGPAWFRIPGYERGPLDFLGLLARAGELAPGGYQIERRGLETSIRTAPGGAAFGGWQLTPWSRTNQILRGLSLPRDATPDERNGP